MLPEPDLGLDQSIVTRAGQRTVCGVSPSAPLGVGGTKSGVSGSDTLGWAGSGDEGGAGAGAALGLAGSVITAGDAAGCGGMGLLGDGVGLNADSRTVRNGIQ